MSAGKERLDGTVAMITGGSRGIGACVADRLAALGASLVLVARDQTALEVVAGRIEERGGRALTVSTDLSAPAVMTDVIERAIAHYGRLDVLVNNAGILPQAKQIFEIGLEEWQRTLDMNLTGPWYLSKLAYPYLKADGGGNIVNVASVSALEHTIGRGGYGVSKAGFAMMTKAFAKEWARDGIRVNCVAPGVVRTELGVPVLEYLESKDRSPNPLDRYAEPEDVAEMIAFLATGHARHVTGTVIPIDGGELL